MFERFSKVFYFGVDKNTPYSEIRKFIFLNIILLITSFLLVLFGVYNIVFTKQYDMALVDLLAFLVFMYALYTVERDRSLKQAAMIVSVNSFVLLIALVYFIQGADFTLIWVLFFPVIAIFINGSKKGLIFSLLFYFIVFYIAYDGIGVWLNGLWNSASFTRFVAANSAMLFITYFFERSFEAAQKELAKNRTMQQQYISALKEASITDPLTQLYNRRHLDTMFREKFLKAKENKSFFAFFILDIDHFKDYNDTYGHTAGDFALKEVSDILKKSMRREADSVFRLGGEEFAGILMADREEKILYVVENIRNNIEQLSVEHSKSRFGCVTVSIGVCIVENLEEANLDQMYKIADSALYEAKTQGRNQIRVVKISTL